MSRLSSARSHAPAQMPQPDIETDAALPRVVSRAKIAGAIAQVGNSQNVAPATGATLEMLGRVFGESVICKGAHTPLERRASVSYRTIRGGDSSTDELGTAFVRILDRCRGDLTVASQCMKQHDVPNEQQRLVLSGLTHTAGVVNRVQPHRYEPSFVSIRESLAVGLIPQNPHIAYWHPGVREWQSGKIVHLDPQDGTVTIERVDGTLRRVGGNLRDQIQQSNKSHRMFERRDEVYARRAKNKSTSS